MYGSKKDTIVAISTASGFGGIGVIRLSGNRSWQLGKKIFKPIKSEITSLIPVKKMLYGHIVNPENNEKIDEVLCVFFKAPYSYTTENVFEIQCHAGPGITKIMLNLCLQYGCRLAEPGEFTYRAFMGGRIQLTQAEAIADLISANSKVESRLALSVLEGELSKEINKIKNEILEAAATVEAAIDFPDEIKDILTNNFIHKIHSKINNSLSSLLKNRTGKRIYRDGANVVLCGKPNVGKSSLFNELVGNKRALTNATPGTTRDAIEESIIIEGIVCRIIDTAGISKTSDEVEKLGIALSKKYFKIADLILLVLDLSQKLSHEDLKLIKLVKNKNHIIVLNKLDLPLLINDASLSKKHHSISKTSAKTRKGINQLYAQIASKLSGNLPEPIPGEFIINVRQKIIITNCLNAMNESISNLKRKNIEIVSLNLAEALSFLNEIDGKSSHNEIINTLFKKFCVGK